MPDILLALIIPAIVGASGLYAAADRWWRRRHPNTDAYPNSPAHRLALAAVAEGEQAAQEAERIVAEAHDHLAPLYEYPTTTPAH